MHANSVVADLAHRRLAGVHPHADPTLDAVGPGVARERALAVDRRLDPVARTGERDEERVALGADLVAVVRDERLTEEPAMVGQQLAVPLAELLEQARRALDVGEEHRHRPRGQHGHDSFVPQSRRHVY
jgi:hypothetical protein